MNQIVYVTSSTSHQIYVWLLEPKFNSLRLIQVIYTVGQPQPIAIHPNKKFLYVGTRPDFKIITYYINALGFLKKISDTEIFSSPTYLSLDKNGQFLFCGSYQNNDVSVMSIHISGIPNTPIKKFKNLLGCHSINIDQNTGLIWIPCLKEDTIRLLKQNSFNQLQLQSWKPNQIFIKKGSGPRHMQFMKFHDFCSYAFIINELNNTISVIQYNNICQKFNFIQTLMITPYKMKKDKKFWASDIHITPNKNWLFCSDRLFNAIHCFKICNFTKKLKHVESQNTEKQPRGFAIDKTGKFLIVAGQKSNFISLYKINLYNGKFYFLSRHYTGKNPVWVTTMLL